MHEHAHHGMRPLEDLLPYEEALRRVIAAAAPVRDAETVQLLVSEGRVLAESVDAIDDVPAFDRAAMDGYALRAADSGPGARLRVAGNVHAGEAYPAVLEPGECVQIATGAPVPRGSDAVVQVERTRLEAGEVLLEGAVAPRHNVSPRGSDMHRGDRIGVPDRVLNPARIAVLAAAGRATLRVWRRPRIAVLSTGSELRPPGTPLAVGQIHESNGIALDALFRSHGAEVVRPAPIPDDVQALRTALRANANDDMIVLSGGSSAGERDVVRDAVRAEGTVDFHGVRVKPGKPLLLGRVGTAMVIGLPGYPTSCLSDAYLFVLPALRRIAHRPESPERRVTARMGERVAGVPGRLWFLPVRLENGRAIPTYKDSGATTSLSDAEGYVRVPAGTASVEAGDAVDVVLF